MAGPARRESGKRRAPSEAEILDAALALLDAGGLAGASIRRIAAAVGAPPGAVYTYFPDRTAVVRALVERLLGEVDRASPETGNQPWRDTLEAVALTLRERLAAHPGVVPLLVSGPMDGPNALLLRERLLGVLYDAGIAGESGARGAYVVMVYVLGSVTLEVVDVPFPGALPPEAERIAARRAVLAGIPADIYPRTAEAADVMATWTGTEQYLWGLRRVLNGLVGPELQ
ncbi:MAG TPA: TetR/AcrR family transcriptional regulator C-terminal domain-containing protein [Actinoplanes sp.]|jgi:AcrR family transcriptional regulator